MCINMKLKIDLHSIMVGWVWCMVCEEYNIMLIIIKLDYVNIVTMSGL